MGKKTWDVAHAIYGTEKYLMLIRDGYEPFEVVDRSPNAAEIWLKKLRY